MLNAKNIAHIKASITGDDLFDDTDLAELAAVSDHKQIMWLTTSIKRGSYL